MNDRSDLIAAWLDKASKDIRIAEHELSFDEDEIIAEAVCFHCQQATEKFLKAYLVFLHIPFEKIHDIGELIAMCSEKDKNMKIFEDRADRLTVYAVEIRYPDSIVSPSLADAREAFDIAKEIKEYVINKIGAHQK